MRNSNSSENSNASENALLLIAVLKQSFQVDPILLYLCKMIFIMYICVCEIVIRVRMCYC